RRARGRGFLRVVLLRRSGRRAGLELAGELVEQAVQSFKLRLVVIEFFDLFGVPPQRLVDALPQLVLCRSNVGPLQTIPPRSQSPPLALPGPATTPKKCINR